MLQDRRHPQKDSAGLLNQAAELIKSARENLERENYQTAWDEARRAGRPLRILMRYHFMAAYDEIVKVLNDEDLPCGPVAYEGQKKPRPRIVPPIVAAPLASFSTLPQAWIWADWIRTGRLGRNLLPGGDFSDPDSSRTAAGPTRATSPRRSRPGSDRAGAAPTRPRTATSSHGGPPPEGADGRLAPAVRRPSPGGHPVAGGEGRGPPGLPDLGDGEDEAPDRPGRRRPDRPRLDRRRAAPVPDPEALEDNWYEIVYYRRVPADGTLSVTLGHGRLQLPAPSTT